MGKAKIREDRGLVNECNGFDGLQFDDTRIFHKQVEAETTLQLDGFVDYRNGLFSGYFETSKAEFLD